MLHGCGQRLLIIVTLGLHIKDHLQIDPVGNPVPILIVDDDILLHDAFVIIAPGEKCAVIAAKFSEAGKRLTKAAGVGKALAVNAGQLFHLVVHLAEKDRFDINLKFFAGRPVIVEFDCADLNNFAAKVYR